VRESVKEALFATVLLPLTYCQETTETPEPNREHPPELILPFTDPAPKTDKSPPIAASERTDKELYRTETPLTLRDPASSKFEEPEILPVTVAALVTCTVLPKRAASRIEHVLAPRIVSETERPHPIKVEVATESELPNLTNFPTDAEDPMISSPVAERDPSIQARFPVEKDSDIKAEPDVLKKELLEITPST
jgi:hypothetical protein